MLLRVLVFSAVFSGLLLSADNTRAATFTLSDLVAGGSTGSFTSDDGTFTFSNFEVTRLKRLSGDLSVYLVSTTPTGFVLTSTEFDVASGGHRKLDFSYTVTANSPIVQAALDVDAVRDTGRIFVGKDLDDPTGDEGTFLAATLKGGSSMLSDSDQFSPGPFSFDVEEQVRIKRIASIASIANSFQVVPEPATAALLGTGMLGLAVIGRRRRRAAA